MRGALAASAVSPAWRLLLLSDGSVTRHLQIVSGRLHSCFVLSRARGCAPAGCQAASQPRARTPDSESTLPSADNETEVEVIRQDVGGAEAAGADAELSPLPKECALLELPLLQRQVRALSLPARV